MGISGRIVINGILRRQGSGAQLMSRHRSTVSGSTEKRRVVVTGTGLVTCLGTGVQNVWNKLVEGQSGIVPLEQKEFADIPSRVAGLVPRGNGVGELDLSLFPSGAKRDMSPATLYVMAAADAALQQAGWIDKPLEERQKTGVALGTAMMDMDYIAENATILKERGYRRVSPHFVTRILLNMPAGHITLKYGFQGPNHAVSTACATGVHSIGDASRFIQYGDADVMVCGATDACVTPLSMAAFARMRALSTSFNDRPQEASRPFDGDREGFVMSEGSGVLVLEELNHALDRGATIYGEILGYGLSGDTNHITAPSDDGEGAFRCMKQALRNAGVSTEEVGYVNAHATSTPLGDASESKALARLFGDHASSVPVSSTKGAIGHMMGAAGCVETIFTLLACQYSLIPPTLNCNKPDTECNLDYVPNKSRAWVNDGKRKVALCNSFGFGGTNACICVGSME